MTPGKDFQLTADGIQTDISDYGSNAGYERTDVQPTKSVKAIRSDFMMVTSEWLPRIAFECEWPIVFDHCFQRVCYDMAFGDEWTGHVDGSPAYKHIDTWRLVRALRQAESMLYRGEPQVRWLNARSLHYRGELDCYPHQLPVVCAGCGEEFEGGSDDDERYSPIAKWCPFCEGQLMPDYSKTDIHHQFG